MWQVATLKKKTTTARWAHARTHIEQDQYHIQSAAKNEEFTNVFVCSAKNTLTCSPHKHSHDLKIALDWITIYELIRCRKRIHRWINSAFSLSFPVFKCSGQPKIRVPKSFQPRDQCINHSYFVCVWDYSWFDREMVILSVWLIDFVRMTTTNVAFFSSKSFDFLPALHSFH